MAKYGTFVERLDAVAAGDAGRWVAVAGHRDGPESLVSVISLPKLASLASVPVGAPVLGLARLAGDLLVVQTPRSTIVLELAEGGATRVFERERPNATAIACDALGQVLAIGFEDGTVEVSRWVAEAPPRIEKQFEGRALDAKITALSIDHAIVVAGGESGAAASVSYRAADPVIRKYELGEEVVTSACILGDGRVAFGRADGAILLAYLEGELELESRTGELPHGGPVRSLVLGPELEDEAGRSLRRRLISVGADGALRAWSMSDRRRPKTVELPQSAGAPTCLSWVPAAPRAKKKQGQLAVVTAGRRLALVSLGEQGELEESIDWVESELDRLAVDTGASSPAVREAALKALGAIPEDDARGPIERILSSDKRPELRALAARTLGSRALAREALVRSLSDAAAEVRSSAFESLFAIDVANPLDAARAGLSASQEDVRLAAVKRLPGLRARSPLVPAMLGAALKDSEASVRTAALDALSSLDAAGTFGGLEAGLRRGAPDVRAEALVRLWIAGRTRDAAGRAFLGASLDDVDPSVRERAFQIALLSSPRLSKRIADLDKSLAPKLQELEQRNAGPSDDGPLDEAAKWPLTLAASCRAADTALRAAKALAILGDTRAVGSLLQLSREPEAGMRIFVVMALEAAATALPADEKLRARLSWLLDDSESGVRSSALSALMRLATAEGAPATLELAEATLRAAHPDVRGRAVEMLSGLGKPGAEESLRGRADELLGEALDDEDSKVRTEAFRTLASWHLKAPETAMARAARSRQADIRRRIVQELTQKRGAWVRPLLITLASDPSADVGRAAYEALTKGDSDKKAPDAHLAAMASPRPEVRALGAKGASDSNAGALRKRLVELVEDPNPAVHLAAIESVDRLVPNEEHGFRVALSSVFYELRVRAAELLGRRRDARGAPAMTELLSIPVGRIDRPSDPLRQRAARALADVGDPSTIPFLRALLDDPDGLVREMGARGLATASRPGNLSALAEALGHEDLAVRSWAAEGLSRLGDVRALPVLAGTQSHAHRPIRVGAILGFVALGAEGVRGILKGLEDPDREVQDLVLAVIVARDLALLRAGLEPDLLYSALAAVHPEVRFAAARALESRLSGESWETWATELVGPTKPEKAADAKSWPEAAQQKALLNSVVRALASSDPAQRYSAAQVLALRPQAETYWKEAALLTGPALAGRPWIPSTNFSEEKKQGRKKEWVRRLFARDVAKRPRRQRPKSTFEVLSIVTRRGPAVTGADPETSALLLGTYSGLVRRVPGPAETDEGHRVRRDAIARLTALSAHVGRDAVEPVMLHAISDPHYLVRRAAVQALSSLYPAGSLEPLRIALLSASADVGRPAFDVVLERAMGQDLASRELALGAVDAPNPEVRAYAAARIERLWPKGSVEPWLVALTSQHADVRLAAMDRLLDAGDARVDEALLKALESDHEDLRQKAALSLARRGDARTLDVLDGLLRSREAATSAAATDALVALAAKSPKDAPSAAHVVRRRLESDTDKTANRESLLAALGRIGDPGSLELLRATVCSTEPADVALRSVAFEAAVAIAEDRKAGKRKLEDGRERRRLLDPVALAAMSDLVRAPDAELRARVAEVLEDVQSEAAEPLLTKLLRDRDPVVRVRACEAVAFRAEHQGGSIALLELALREGRRELVLPAAAGLASRGRKEAFQALMLVMKAGQGPTPGATSTVLSERERAILALGSLADPRAIPELVPLLRPSDDVPDETKALAPSAAEALARMLGRLAPEKAEPVREAVDDALKNAPLLVQKGALSGLAGSGDDTSRAKVEAIARDPGEGELRLHAIKELGKLGRAESEPVLRDAIGGDDESAALLAARALLRVFAGDRTRLALAALESPHDELAQPAARFLAERGEPATLAARLSDVRSAPVRRSLALGLLRRGGAPSSALASALSREDAASRASAAWIAGAGGDASLGPSIVAVGLSAAKSHKAERGRPSGKGTSLREQEDAWRGALWAATRLGVDAIALAEDTARDAKAPSSVRTEAARHLAERAGAKHLELLTGLISDPVPAIRELAANGLARLGKRLGAPPRGSDPARTAALASIAEKSAWLASVEGRRAILPALIQEADVDDLLRLAEAGVDRASRIAAIRALARVSTAAVREALARIHSDPKADDDVKKAAFLALKRNQRSILKVYSADQDQDRGPKVRTRTAFDRDDDSEDDSDDDDDDDSDGDDDSDDGESDDEDSDDEDSDDEDSDDEDSDDDDSDDEDSDDDEGDDDD
ncbi:MAG: HEAT repeat domain-containing protein [Deltaproteobacteria bacterium]|nr:HEAT repeat domain-containing protein [Deltaproteobacteria bacterium]